MPITTSGGVINLLNTYTLAAGLAGGLDGTGTATATTVAAGSTLTVGGRDPSTAITFATLTTALGGSVDFAGGNSVITALTSAGGAVTVEPSTTLTVNGLTGVSALTNFRIATGGTLVFGRTVGLSALEQINFTGSSGAVMIDSAGLGVSLATGIVGFRPGDNLDINGANFDPTQSSYDPITGTLSLFNTGTRTIQSLRLVNNANLAGEYFQITNSAGGAVVSLSATQGSGFPACYVRGTRVATPQGQVEIQDLAVGDMLVTGSGGLRQIHWIGRRSYSGRFLGANRRLQPVIIRQGALGGGLPDRDLLISENHALLIEGVLIPAASLVNGASIARAHIPQVEYFHVELESHDVILAEGVPSETFVDDESRGMFQNCHEYRAAHPDKDGLTPVYCAPRIDHGPILEEVRRRIAVVEQRPADAA